MNKVRDTLDRSTSVRLFFYAYFLVKYPYLMHVHHARIHDHFLNLLLLFWRYSGRPQWSKRGIAEAHGIYIRQALELRT